MTLLSIHVLSVIFSTALTPMKSDAPTRILTAKQNITTVILRSTLMMIGMAMILYSSFLPQQFFLSVPGAVLYWAANADALSTEILLFSLVGKRERAITESE